MPCREEGLADGARDARLPPKPRRSPAAWVTRKTSLLELSIGIAFAVVKAEPNNEGARSEQHRFHALAAARDYGRQPGVASAVAVFHGKGSGELGDHPIVDCEAAGLLLTRTKPACGRSPLQRESARDRLRDEDRY